MSALLVLMIGLQPLAAAADDTAPEAPARRDPPTATSNEPARTVDPAARIPSQQVKPRHSAWRWYIAGGVIAAGVAAALLNGGSPATVRTAPRPIPDPPPPPGP
jgi:hypothetical protein